MDKNKEKKGEREGEKERKRAEEASFSVLEIPEAQKVPQKGSEMRNRFIVGTSKRPAKSFTIFEGSERKEETQEAKR